MAERDRAERRVVAAALARHGRTFADDVGADLVRGDVGDLFRLLVFAILASARIRGEAAVRATRALFDAGWTDPAAMAAATWEERVRVLNAHGYARYDESTSRVLADACAFVLDTYGGDLGRLRERAGGDAEAARRLLREIKGLGPVGADIFLREAQAAWPELAPYVDERVRAGARELGLPTATDELAALVEPERFPDLAAALVRGRLGHDADAIRQAAGTA